MVDFVLDDLSGEAGVCFSQLLELLVLVADFYALIPLAWTRVAK